MLKQEEFEKFLIEINELLNEIRQEQINLGKNIDKYHKVNRRSYKRKIKIAKK